MTNKHITIPKKPNLRESVDYNLLRKKGIDLIEKLGSTYWTDYNIHDPGITLLELLCFAQTEIGHRLGFSIQDLLTLPPNQNPKWDEQAFFTARTILTVNPFTANDFRKLLADQRGIANAWMACSDCTCHPEIYADCKEETLTYEKTEHPVQINGFWDAMLELEVDSKYGDLNGGKVFYGFSFSGQRATAEIRFMPWHKARNKEELMNVVRAGEILSIEQKSYHIDVADDKFYKALRSPLRIDVSYEVTTDTGTELVVLKEVPVKIWFREDEGREIIKKTDIRKVFDDVMITGAISQYLYQLKAADEAVDRAEKALQAHRNLAEDYCRITTVPVEDVGICADIDMSADADIEQVLGQAYYEIIQYLNPPVQFYTLDELLSAGKYTEEIFDGPPLKHGFILKEELDQSMLREYIYASDIINILMDIDGIESVRNFTLVRFDASGKLVESSPWELKVKRGHQPRFYIHASKVLVYKNDLPFLPFQDELHDTLQMWQGISNQNKVVQSKNDLAVPKGEYLDQTRYYPIQYSLPETYGIGPYGLKEPSTTARKAQASQLRSYMMVFEHLFATFLGQLGNFRSMLSTDPSTSKTYFGKIIEDRELSGIDGFYTDLDKDRFQALLEDREAFLDRRNGFLDHLLARFAESFSDYALMLYQAYGSEDKAQEELIFDKINFIEKFPHISANRARAINYKGKACHPSNKSGLSERIKVVLGLNGLYSFIRYSVFQTASGLWDGTWYMENEDGEILLVGTELSDYEEEYNLREQIRNGLENALIRLADETALQVEKEGSSFFVVLKDEEAENLAFSNDDYETEVEAENHRKAVLEFVSRIRGGEKIFVVEHMLLRPRNEPSEDIPEGDPFLPICIGRECDTCGEEDPYSFRITVVLNGEYGIANSGIAFRRYAEKTIRLETPAHLGVKVCWVSAKQLKEFETLYCRWLKELSKKKPDPGILHTRLSKLIHVFKDLKSVYPQATLHDCQDGDDENPVRLNSTII